MTEEAVREPNRAERRRQQKEFRRIVRRPAGCTSTFHPLLGCLTPRGEKLLAKRRAKNKVAKLSRKRNRK